MPCASTVGADNTPMMAAPIADRENDVAVLINDSINQQSAIENQQSEINSHPAFSILFGPRERFAGRNPLDGDFRYERSEPLRHLSHAPVLRHHVTEQNHSLLLTVGGGVEDVLGVAAGLGGLSPDAALDCVG